MKRWIAVALLIGLCVSLFSGCESNGKEDAAELTEGETLTVDVSSGATETEQTDEPDEPDVFSPIWPCRDSRYITTMYYYYNDGYPSKHGTRSNIYNAFDVSGGGSGDPIYATESGTVVFAGWDDSGYGNCVVIHHGDGMFSLYGHMLDNSITVELGSWVQKGAVIGGMGNTGNSFGTHLHFEMYCGTVTEVMDSGNTLIRYDVKVDRDKVVDPWPTYFRGQVGGGISAPVTIGEKSCLANQKMTEDARAQTWCNWLKQDCVELGNGDFEFWGEKTELESDEKDRKTVYLCTGSTSTTYDTDGNVSYKHERTTKFNQFGQITEVEDVTDWYDGVGERISQHNYEFDDSGNIQSVRYWDGENTFELRACYENGRLAKYLGEYYSEPIEITFGYDEDGRMKSLDATWYWNAWDQIRVSYYPNGNLQEYTCKLRESSFYSTYYYRENGTLMKYCEGASVDEDFSLDQLGQSEIVRVRYCNEYGLPTHTEGWRKVTISTIEGKRVVNKEDAVIGEVSYEWDEATRTLTGTGTEGTDVVILRTIYDEAGNAIYFTMEVNGRVMQESTSTCISMELPEDYKKPNSSDLFYLHF